MVAVAESETTLDAAWRKRDDSMATGLEQPYASGFVAMAMMYLWAALALV
jgi:hypothetical protein